jgi:hypothetical protein
VHHLVWEIASNVEHGSSLSACNRREVLRWGLVLAGSVLLDPRFAFAQGMVDDPAQAARGDSTHATPAISLAPREKLLFDFNWRFFHGSGRDPAPISVLRFSNHPCLTNGTGLTIKEY